MTRSHHLLTLPQFLLTPTPPNGIVFFLNPNDNNNYISSSTNNTSHFHYYCHPFFLNQINKILSFWLSSQDWLPIGHLNLSWVSGQDPSFSWSRDLCEFCPLFPLIYELNFCFWCWWDLHLLFVIGCVDLEHHQFVDNYHSIRSWIRICFTSFVVGAIVGFVKLVARFVIDFDHDWLSYLMHYSVICRKMLGGNFHGVVEGNHSRYNKTTSPQLQLIGHGEDMLWRC